MALTYHACMALTGAGDRDPHRPENQSQGWAAGDGCFCQKGSAMQQPGSGQQLAKCPLMWLLESQKSPDKALNSEKETCEG